MPPAFTVTPTPPTTLRLAVGEEGKFRFTITSLAAPDKAQDVVVRAFLVGKDGKREEVEWVSAEPTQPLAFTGGATEIATIVVRPTAKSPRGESAIQLAIFDDDRPNDAFTYSTPVTCDVLGAAGETKTESKPGIPVWLIAALAAAGLLGIAGIVLARMASGAANASRQLRVPPGTIVAFGSKTPPDGWLLCDGKPVSRSEDSALFTAIGVSWGPGDGTTTFNVPDLRGLFLRGADEEGHKPLRDLGIKDRTGLDGKPFAGVGSLQVGATALPLHAFAAAASGNHDHAAPTWTGVPGPLEVASAASGMDYIGAAPVSQGGVHTHAVIGGDEETRPINVAVAYIIKR